MYLDQDWEEEVNPEPELTDRQAKVVHAGFLNHRKKVSKVLSTFGQMQQRQEVVLKVQTVESFIGKLDVKE